MNHVPTSIGRYEVERLLGEGGMGVLYLARDPVLDRHVALKLLRVNGEDLRRRFMREAQSAGRLQHPNIVTVYDVGDHDGQLYIAMEYIDGDTLATLIRDDAPFSAIRKLDIIDEVAEGLGFAHQRGIIHRDIKPANLMMSRGGLVKVLDFGIARVATHRDSGEIDAPTLIGTPAYMAPEQLEGADVDARSDIYAVGLVMYEFFSGRRAFSGATTADVLQKVLDAQPIPIGDLIPDIDPDLCKVIGRAMARQPTDRYPDLQAMRKDLARARRRAMQASGDDATIVVGLPVTRPMGQAPPPPDAVRATVVPPPTPPPATPAQAVALPPTAADRGLAHLAAQRPSVPRSPAPSSEETIYAPVAARAPATAPQAAPIPAPVSHAATGPVPEPIASVPPPPLPSPGFVPTSAGSEARTATPPDEGPVPVPLPAVPSSGMFPLLTAGRATVDAPVVPTARERTAAGPVAGSGAETDAKPASPPRMAVAAAPPPVAAPGVVQGSPVPGPPTTRRGIPAAIIVGGLVAMLAICFIAAFLAVRSFGLLRGTPISGLLTRTVEPKVTNPPHDDAPATTTPPATESTPVTATAATTPGTTEVAVAPPVEPPVAPPVVATESPRPTVQEPPAVVQPPVTRPTTPPPGRVPPPRQAPPARQTTNTRQVPTVPTRPVTTESREVAPPPVVAEPPPRQVERREPDPPAVVAPTDEGIALVRAYVAARNTAHASGIRRVWPGVDDNHLRRITSAFSAPLTLGGCEIEARDAAHASATCRLTQPGTTGTYAAGQDLTIRRTFVFDLLRQGRTWVIAGLRE